MSEEGINKETFLVRAELSFLAKKERRLQKQKEKGGIFDGTTLASWL